MKRLPIILLLLLSFSGLASQDVTVLGLFNGKAYLSISGSKKLMKNGESFKGVTLIQATSRWAKIKNDAGVISKITTGGTISGSYKAPVKQALKIYPNSNGMYQVNGHINNTPIAFLIDTGATYVAMSEIHAKKMGLKYKQKGKRSSAQTASGIVTTWELKLDSVEVGGIRVNYVPAAVISGDHPYQVLLGMSYLKNLKVEHSGTVMLLQKKY